MTEKTGAPAADAGTTVAKAEHDAALAQTATTAKAEGEKVGAAAAQTRIKTILGAKEAEGRAALANHFAFATDMTAEAAVAALAVAPKEKAAAPVAANRLDALMEAETPAVADAAHASSGDTAAAGLSAAVTRQLAALGRKPLTAH